MPKVSLAFFTVAPIYVLIGMAGGIYMGVIDDHSLAPAHAHLNLIGFVMMSVMGTFYALAKAQISTRLAWINFWLLNLAVVVMIRWAGIGIDGSFNWCVRGSALRAWRWSGPTSRRARQWQSTNTKHGTRRIRRVLPCPRWQRALRR